MKIGLLAYHAACNFGAFLQLLSTVEYIKKQGDEPIVINWIPKDFSKDYEKRSLLKVRDLYVRIRKQYYPMTELCETDKQVAKVIEKERIEALLAGSAKTYPALELFDGLMYRSIERQDLSEKEQAYLQEHLLITTALYGVLPAYEGIGPHRLDFMMKLKQLMQSLQQVSQQFMQM